ncbi:MAG: tetratricopeptide repeat protein, partial [Pirellulaceae bacterium]|nr:tetratricopeptide repeat protein [Pirellulaceae bacterium]
LTTAAVIAMLFVTGTAVSVWQAVRATSARNAADESAREARANELKAVAERDLKEEALEAETAARKQARDALNTMTDDVIQKVFSQQPVLDDSQKAFLRKVMTLYESFAAQSRTSEESRFLAADGKARVAKILLVLGERPEAMALYRDVIPELRKLTKEFPMNPDLIELLASCHLSYGTYIRESGDPSAAEPELREALALQEALCTSFPENADYQYGLAGILHLQTMLSGGFGRFDETEASARRSVEILEGLTTRFTDRADFTVSLGNELNQLYITLVNRGKTREAFEILLRGIEILENSVAYAQGTPKCQIILSLMYGNKANLLVEMEKFEEAEMLISKSIAMRRSLSDRFPSAPDYRRDLASAYSSLGALRLKQSRDLEAIENYGQAQRLLRANLQRDPLRFTDRTFLIKACGGRATALIHLGKSADAISDWKEAEIWAAERSIPKLLLQRAISLSDITDSSFQQDVENAKKEALEAWKTGAATFSPTDRIKDSLAIVTKLNEPAAAAAAVESIVASNKLDNLWLYNAACVIAQCAASSRSNEAQQKQFADRAMELLNQAVRAGWKDAAHIKRDTDLDPLRERADFKALVEQIDVLRPKVVEDATQGNPATRRASQQSTKLTQ